ncbi:MAG: nucleotidyl transferase AbiEii/AbiGii toxin family protein [Bacteroidales bacterium]|nr:nucleotidyl transferase AbiEii/AbiGii toxin family protein [Bacteroidales bacterium]MBR5100327.1 nucleotidyl transferase AbiEii/AbiGii toxin family protein [Bacteroidales bacterium]
MPTENNVSEITGLTPATQEVFEQVSQLDCIKDLFLCGGTGQSLQMNHRLSEDLDFELIGLRKERPELDFGAILGEIKSKFPDAREEILGEDHFLVFINEGRVKLSFFRPENPVKTMKVGWQHNNLKIPTLQELLGMKVYAICVRTVFRDYYDIYCLLKAGCNLTEAVSYASYLSRHTIRSKSMYTKLLSPQLFRKDEDFQRMSPAEDISPEEIRDYIKAVMENEH